MLEANGVSFSLSVFLDEALRRGTVGRIRMRRCKRSPRRMPRSYCGCDFTRCVRARRKRSRRCGALRWAHLDCMEVEAQSPTMCSGRRLRVCCAWRRRAWSPTDRPNWMEKRSIRPVGDHINRYLKSRKREFEFPDSNFHWEHTPIKETSHDGLLGWNFTFKLFH